MEHDGHVLQNVEESRALRIEAAATRTDLAVAVFAFFDTQANATLTIEQSRQLCIEGNRV